MLIIAPRMAHLGAALEFGDVDCDVVGRDHRDAEQPLGMRGAEFGEPVVERAHAGELELRSWIPYMVRPRLV